MLPMLTCLPASLTLIPELLIRKYVEKLKSMPKNSCSPSKVAHGAVGLCCQKLSEAESMVSVIACILPRLVNCIKTTTTIIFVPISYLINTQYVADLCGCSAVANQQNFRFSPMWLEFWFTVEDVISSEKGLWSPVYTSPSILKSLTRFFKLH